VASRKDCGRKGKRRRRGETRSDRGGVIAWCENRCRKAFQKGSAFGGKVAVTGKKWPEELFLRVPHLPRGGAFLKGETHYYCVKGNPWERFPCGGGERIERRGGREGLKPCKATRGEETRGGTSLGRGGGIAWGSRKKITKIRRGLH